MSYSQHIRVWDSIWSHNVDNALFKGIVGDFGNEALYLLPQSQMILFVCLCVQQRLESEIIVSFWTQPHVCFVPFHCSDQQNKVLNLFQPEKVTRTRKGLLFLFTCFFTFSSLYYDRVGKLVVYMRDGKTSVTKGAKDAVGERTREGWGECLKRWASCYDVHFLN